MFIIHYDLIINFLFVYNIAQTFKQENHLLKRSYAKQKKILEINPNHSLILGLLIKAENDAFDANTKEMVHVLL